MFEARGSELAREAPPPSQLDRASRGVAPEAWFGISAIFHCLGPAFAVLLFPVIDVVGVAWLRIASAALVFAPATRPWRWLARAEPAERWLVFALGACLALLNCSFYLALARLPISLVAEIEFVGTIGLALYGLRTRRNVAALALAVVGMFVLIDVRWASDITGLAWAFLNGVLFVGYIRDRPPCRARRRGHGCRAARCGDGGRARWITRATSTPTTPSTPVTGDG